MPRDLSDSFFGSIALKNRMLTREQLTRALRVQLERSRAGTAPSLGEVCRMLGLLREDEVNAIVWAQGKSEAILEDSLLGRICVKNRLINPAQLDEALEDQRALDFTLRLGDILCQKGYLDRQELAAVLKTQSRLKSQRLRPIIMPPAHPHEAAPARPSPAKTRAKEPARKRPRHLGARKPSKPAAKKSGAKRAGAKKRPR